MANQKLGRTARFYRKNKRSRRKHSRDNSPGGPYAHSNAYKREHADARNRLKIRSVNVDASKQADGSYKAESRKTNRGRGGAQRR